jgi:hypothetical protein
MRNKEKLKKPTLIKKVSLLKQMINNVKKDNLEFSEDSDFTKKLSSLIKLKPKDKKSKS